MINYWRVTCWFIEWLKLVDAIVYISTFTYYNPRLWGRTFDYLLDRAWL